MGTADSAVISPDARRVVFSAQDTSGTSIWRRDLAGRAAVKLVQRLTEKVSDLDVTDGGGSLSSVTYPVKNPSNRRLYKVPLDGGAVTQIGDKFPGPVSVSSDGRQVAFYVSDPAQGNDKLLVWDLKTNQHHLLTSYKYPVRFTWTAKPAWSFDHKKIAYATEERDDIGFLVRLYVVDTATGTRQAVPSPRWQWVQGIQWTHDGSALAIVGQEHESSFQQIWYLPYPGSVDAIRRIGNDLDDYFGASLSARGSEIVSVQSQTLSNIYLARSNDLAHPKQITTGS